MADTTELRQELAEANRHIVESRAQIARQRQLIGQLSADGHDVTDAEKLLRTLEESLEAMQRHREHIRRQLSRAEHRRGK
jgi:chromosome segregation ATPase